MWMLLLEGSSHPRILLRARHHRRVAFAFNPSSQRAASTGTSGRLVGLVLLHRHGHRAPMKNCWDHPDHSDRASEEERLWRDWLPLPEHLEALNSTYPIQSSALNAPKDDLSAPFGCLTVKGLEDMVAMGKMLRSYYDRVSQGRADFRVYATNFLRTQRSAQALLSGFQAHDLVRQSAPAEEEQRISGPILPVVVRREKDCTIHMYDNSPDSIKEEVARLMNSQEFLKITAESETLQRDLSRLVPGLKSLPFKWMEAADFFWCRQASGIELPKEVQALSEPTIRCVIRRFRLYYEHKPLLKLVIGPLAKEIFATIQAVASGDVPLSDAAPLVSVYSGHDVTILALLYALKSPIVASDSWWPPYGCTLVFELLRTNDEVWIKILLAGSDSSSKHSFISVLGDDDRGVPLGLLARRLGVEEEDLLRQE